jgi:hypothetical protein
MRVIGLMPHTGRPRRSVRKAAWIAAVVVVVAGTVAVSPAHARTDDIAKRGIARAKAAGIRIDPAAEPIMEAAPAGSCLNDPTQGQCDPPERIVATDSEANALISFCWVYATSLVKSTGNARAYGKFSCTGVADVMELYVTLWMRWKDGVLHQECVGAHPPAGPGPGSIYANCAAPCRDDATRYFHEEAEGYAEAYGDWYAAYAERNANLPCVV